MRDARLSTVVSIVFSSFAVLFEGSGKSDSSKIFLGADMSDLD